MDQSRLRSGELIAAIAAAVLFVVMFFKWYGVKVPGVGKELEKSLGIKLPGELGSVTAWQAFTWIDIFLFLTIVVALALAIVTAMQNAPALPVSLSVVTAIMGILGTLLVAYRIINQPGDNDVVTVKIGAWLGLISVGAIAYGGWRAMADEGSSFGDVRTGVERAAGVRGESQPAPPTGEAPADKAPTTEPPPSAPPPAEPPATEPPAAD